MQAWDVTRNRGDAAGIRNAQRMGSPDGHPAALKGVPPWASVRPMEIREDTGSCITITRAQGWGARAVLVVLGLFPLLGPYELLLKPRWSFGEASLPGLLLVAIPVLISLGCLSMSVMLAASGMWGRNERIEIDRARQEVRWSRWGGLGLPPRSDRFGWATLPRPSVQPVESEGSPDRFDVLLLLPGLKSPVRVCRLDTETDARHMAETLLR